MKKMLRSVALMLAMVMLVSIIQPMEVNAATKKKTTYLLSGITLDVSNRYYSVKEIEKYINLAAKQKNGYVQLHLTGDNAVGIECQYLGQVAKTKYRRKNGAYYNPKTGKCFLSRKEIKTILTYAKKKKVMIVPEIDMPGHVGGFEKLYIKKYGKTNAKIFHADYEGELAIKNKQAIKFAKNIYNEYAKLFKGCKYFHIGCDEFWSGSAKQNASYINTISKYMQKKGFRVWAWNDLFTKTNMKSINKKIMVTYWSYDGDTTDAAERKERRKVRATLPELQAKGFSVLNYNAYYLYLTPNKKNVSKADTTYAVNDAKANWSIRMWDGDSGNKCKTAKRIVGACVSIWGEDSKGVKAGSIYQQVAKLYPVLQKKCIIKK